MRVLVVEDERLLADAIAEGLRRESLAVDVAYDGNAALERIGINDYDVVVLDRDLPYVHGDDVCRAVVDAGASARVPFRRLRDRVGSAQGTGLGLSIVRSVARAHGGSATAVPNDGGGLVVRVTLPTA